MFKITQFFKNLFKNKEIKTQKESLDRYLGEYYLYKVILQTESNKVIETFLSLDQKTKEDILNRIVLRDIFIKQAIEIIIAYTKKYEVIYKHEDKELEKIIRRNFIDIDIEKTLENILYFYLINGYYCYQPIFKDNLLAYLVKIDGNNLKGIEEKDNKIYLKIDDKKYTDNDFLFDRNNDYFEFGLSPIIAILPYFNNHMLLLDSINLNLGRFGRPITILKTQKSYNEEFRNKFHQELQELVKPLNLPRIILNEKEANIEFEYPVNILENYINLIEYYIKIVFIAFGIGGTLIIEGGSYAKAKIQEEMLASLSYKLLLSLRKQIMDKIIKPLICYNKEKYFFDNNLGEIKIVKKEVQKDERKHKRNT